MGPTYTHPILIKNALTDEECEYIKHISIDRLSTSIVGYKRYVDETLRVSETCFLDYEQHHKLKNIILRFVKPEDYNRCEQLQVVRYKTGGFFKPHQDIIAEDPNLRHCTILFSLNSDYGEGGTFFPVLKKCYKLIKGDALKFENLDDWGGKTEKSMHGGNAVSYGEKWVCNLWIRENPVR